MDLNRKGLEQRLESGVYSQLVFAIPSTQKLLIGHSERNCIDENVSKEIYYIK